MTAAGAKAYALEVKRPAALVALALLAAPAAAQEFGGLGRMLGFGADHAGYEARVEPARLGSPSLFRQQADAVASISAGTGTWTVGARAGEVALGLPRVVTPRGGVVVPAKLWNLQADAGYGRVLGDRRRWGANLAFGSASDEPFLAWREDQLSATAFYQLPSKQLDSWLLLLNYSNNRPFLNNVPLPGFAYVLVDLRHRLQAFVGFPFAYARWQPAQAWTVTATLFGGTTYSLEAARQLGSVSVYARAARQPLQWLRAARADDDDRLVYDSKELRVGARAASGRLSGDLSAGRVFDRRFFEAHDSGSRPFDDSASMAADWLFQAQAAWRWGERPRS